MHFTVIISSNFVCNERTRFDKMSRNDDYKKTTSKYVSTSTWGDPSNSTSSYYQSAAFLKGNKKYDDFMNRYVVEMNKEDGSSSSSTNNSSRKKRKLKLILKFRY